MSMVFTITMDLENIPFYKSILFAELLHYFFVLIDDKTDMELLNYFPLESVLKTTAETRYFSSSIMHMCYLNLFLKPKTKRPNCMDCVLHIVQKRKRQLNNYWDWGNTYEIYFNRLSPVDEKKKLVVSRYIYDRNEDDAEKFDINYFDHDLFNFSMLNKETMDAFVLKLSFIRFVLIDKLPRELVMVICNNIPNFNSLRNHLILV